jgi:hypothetical protein
MCAIDFPFGQPLKRERCVKREDQEIRSGWKELFDSAS